MNRPTAKHPAIEELDRDFESKFIILYDGWEMDNEGWVMPDGRVFTTSRGIDVVEMNTLEIESKIKVAEASLVGLKRALIATKNGGTR